MKNNNGTDGHKELKVLGIDLAKQRFQLHGVDEFGQVALGKEPGRNRSTASMANLPLCVMGPEACGGAHYGVRELAKLGHYVRMAAPQFVKPYVNSNKNDAVDAEAIGEAVQRPAMRFAP
jgi:transposase